MIYQKRVGIEELHYCKGVIHQKSSQVWWLEKLCHHDFKSGKKALGIYVALLLLKTKNKIYPS